MHTHKLCKKKKSHIPIYVHTYVKKQKNANLKVLHKLGNNREINNIIKWTSTKTIVNIATTTEYFYYTYTTKATSTTIKRHYYHQKSYN